MPSLFVAFASSSMACLAKLFHGHCMFPDDTQSTETLNTEYMRAELRSVHLLGSSSECSQAWSICRLLQQCMRLHSLAAGTDDRALAPIASYQHATQTIDSLSFH